MIYKTQVYKFDHTNTVKLFCIVNKRIELACSAILQESYPPYKNKTYSRPTGFAQEKI